MTNGALLTLSRNGVVQFSFSSWGFQHLVVLNPELAAGELGLPRLQATRRGTRPIRVWGGGCSTRRDRSGTCSPQGIRLQSLPAGGAARWQHRQRSRVPRTQHQHRLPELRPPFGGCRSTVAGCPSAPGRASTGHRSRAGPADPGCRATTTSTSAAASGSPGPCHDEHAVGPLRRVGGARPQADADGTTSPSPARSYARSAVGADKTALTTTNLTVPSKRNVEAFTTLQR